jgi:hypothetical protein
MIRQALITSMALIAIALSAAVTHAAPVKYVLQTPGVV